MAGMLGEFECTLDAKGRIMVPAQLMRQVPAAARKKFVINRGFEGCLVLYPRNVWEIESAAVNRLNMYEKQNRDFVRAFMNGATELALDGQSRLLLPRNLLDYAGIDKDVLLFAFGNRVEVWSPKSYRKMIKTAPEEFAALAEKVMGGKNQDKNDKT